MPRLRCLISNENNPYFNLAAEEYLLKNTEDEIFMLYINEPSVVVGKHQNLLKEINTSWCYKHNIKLARRLSGGGTVYQDSGNVNFSFILNCFDLEKVNYQRFTNPILLSLKLLGLDVHYSSRNDILLKESKVSGNAMHIFKNRVLCHGTLLFSSNLSNLSSALKNNGDRYIDKSIKSVPSKVTNLSEALKECITLDSFVDKLFKNVVEILDYSEKCTFSGIDLQEIKDLQKNKFCTWEWIYGYSPKYLFRNNIALNNKIAEFEMNIEKGIIKEIHSTEGAINILFNKYLSNNKHEYNCLKKIFIDEKLSNYFPEYTAEDFCQILF
jgi:lipoate-protein ligase A